MWFIALFGLIWNSLFGIRIGTFPFTFGTLLLSTFVLSFIADTVYKFMHRGD